MAGGTTNGAVGLEAAHRALVADPAIQFTMGRVAPPPTPPAWLKAVGRFLDRLFKPVGRFMAWLLSFLPEGPWAAIILWTVLGVLAAALAWLIVARLRDGVWRLPRRRTIAGRAIPEPNDAWAPEAGAARALLAEADALARQGQFAQAVHLLLQRSVEDIANRRPALVRPALTARDLAAAEAIPAGARGLFASIARVVERSLFGGLAVGSSDWESARAAYADFAQSRSWTSRAWNAR